MFNLEEVVRAPMLAWRAGDRVYIEADANGRGGGWGIITKVARRWATVEVGGGKASLFDMVRRTEKGGAGFMITPEERLGRLHKSEMTQNIAKAVIKMIE